MTKARVCVVDDNEKLLAFMEKLLAEEGYHVKGVCHSEDAMEQLMAFRPAVVFVDVAMTGLDGYDLCKLIRREPELDGAKIIFLNAKKYSLDRRLAYNAGADSYLVKPFTREEVLKKLDVVLDSRFRVKLWGTRGSIPTPSPDTVRYGGNTSCFEFFLPGREELVIIDAGSGIRELGNRVYRDDGPARGYIFFTHFHLDHILGLPFFMPLYTLGNNFTILGPRLPRAGLQEVLSGIMESHYFPVDMANFRARVEFSHLGKGHHLIDGIDIEILTANHPGVTFIYKISAKGRSVVVAPDNELRPADRRAPEFPEDERSQFVDFMRGTDLLIHDAQYSDAEYKGKRGWGHSPWSEVVKLALEADVKKLLLFHHDPDHHDDEVERKADEARAAVKAAGCDMVCDAAVEKSEHEL